MGDARHDSAPSTPPQTPAHPPRADELSTRQAAEALGRNVRSMRRAIARGELPAVKHGSAYRIAVDDLMRYAARGKPRALPPAQSRLVALPSSPRVASSLPQPLSSFVGRTADVAAVVALLDDPGVRLLTLTGPGGIGKTRLALATARAVRDRFPDGIVFVALAAVARPELVLPALAQALGLREGVGRDRRAQLQAFLGAKRLLLIIDNVEHLLAAAPEIAEVAARAPGVSLLVTSRAPLRVAGERELPVAPLSLPPPGRPITMAALLASDAARLFIERAQARDPDFRVDEVSAPLIAEICARLDGLPLAIELAAAQVKILPPRHLLARLERRLPLLSGGDRDAPRRHHTMRDAIAWSHGLLTAEEQVLFRRLAVFAGGFTLEAAEWVIGSWGDRVIGRAEHMPPITPSPHDPIIRVASLVDQSLLTRESGPEDEPRFRMLETIREYGLEQLAADDAEHAQAAHARYFLRFARALRPWTVMRATRAPVDRLAVDDANLHAALGWLDEHGPAADFVGLVVACRTYWYLQGRLREAELWLERASGKREAASPTDRARLLIATAELRMLQGESARADAVFAEGLPRMRAMNDPFDLALALISHGASLSFGGKYAEAETQLGAALTTAEAIADPTLREAVAGRALANLGVAARGRGDLDLALARGQEALRRYEGLALDLAEAHALLDLGDVAREQGNLRLAVERYLVAMARTGEEGEVRLFADALAGVAVVAAAWGQSRTAVLLFSAADTLRQRGGFAMMLPGDAATAARRLAMLRETLGDEAFTATWAEGRDLPVAEAVAVAGTLAPSSGTLPAMPAQGPVTLTRREQDVLHLLAAGLTDRQIADALFISPGTASWHVHAILGKLDAVTRREAVDQARASGLL